MRRLLILVVVFVLLLAAPSLFRYFNFYQFGAPDRIEPEPYSADAVDTVPTPAANPFVDEPTIGEGAILIDLDHRNQFDLEEIGSLDARLAQRGYQLVRHTGGDLRTALRSVDGFVVIAPLDSFSTDEIDAVTDFVGRGGKLLLLGDPTRFSAFLQETDFSFEVVFERDEIPLNSLSNEFGIIFNGDYLYNMVENEGNFRNIILDGTGFGETAVTSNLQQVVFYGAHSIEVGSEAMPLFAGGDNTWSSATDRPGGLALGAMSANERVLALGDLTFLEDPYSNVLDNGRLIAQIADFLTQTDERDFILADFPFFFEDEIDLIYTGEPKLGPDAFDEIIQLQDGFRQIDKTVTLASELGGGDSLVLGLYNQSDLVADWLDAAGIDLIIDPPLMDEEAEEEMMDEEMMEDEEAEEESEIEEVEEEESEDEEEEVEDEDEEEEEELEITRLIQSEFGQIQMSGTALILLHEGGNGRSLIVLAASDAGLDATIDRLLEMTPADADNALADCLLTDTVAFCPTDVSDEEVELELETGGEPAIEEDDDEEEDEEDEAEDEDDETVDEEDEDEEDEDLPDHVDEIDADDQGSIEIGDTIEAELIDSERHAYTFSQGPATIDITVVGGVDMDTVLELYSPDNVLLETADNTFNEGTEELLGIEIEESGDYTIVVRDFFDNGGSYEITLEGDAGESEADDEEEEEGEEEPIDDKDDEDDVDEPIEEPDEEDEEEELDTESRVFIFIDDDGTPLGDGITAVDELTAGFSDFETTVWVSSEDGLLTVDALEGHDLLVWDSGDYEDSDGFFGEDITTILEFLENEGADLFLTGSIPAVFFGSELIDIDEVRIIDSGTVMTDGLPVGEMVTLNSTVVSLSSEATSEDSEDDFFPMMTNPASAFDDTELVAFAATDSFGEFEQSSVVILFPFNALPDEIQAQILENAIAWFGLN